MSGCQAFTYTVHPHVRGEDLGGVQHPPSSGDTVLHTDITQLIEALDGSAADGAGEPIKITKVNDAVNYALDVQNLDTVNGYGLRVRDQGGATLLRTTKDHVILGHDLTVENGAKVDTLTLATHNHNGGAGMGVQVPTAGIQDDAITAAKVADGAIDAAAQNADGVIPFAKMSVAPASASELTVHTGANSAVHGLGSGIYVVGCKQGQYRIETKSGSAVIDKYSNDTITVTWDNAFSGTPVVASMVGVTAGNGRVAGLGTVSISPTGVSHTLHTGEGDAYFTVTEHFIGIGA